MHRFLEEEAKKQSNIEAITKNALPLLEDKSAPQNVADDWITNFFDKSRIVSDKDMQSLWSRVLAGEANSPGAFAKRTVNLLADLDKEDAILFLQLCGFGWVIENDIIPLIFEVQEKIYTDQGINLNSLLHLETLGLLQLNNLGDFSCLDFPKLATTYYYGQPVTLSFPKDANNDLELGQVLLTRAGQQLAQICDSKPVDGFFQYVKDRWIAQSLIQKPETEPIIPPNTAR